MKVKSRVEILPQAFKFDNRAAPNDKELSIKL